MKVPYLQDRPSGIGRTAKWAAASVRASSGAGGADRSRDRGNPLDRRPRAKRPEAKRTLHEAHGIKTRTLDSDARKAHIGDSHRRIGMWVLRNTGRLADPEPAGLAGDHGVAEPRLLMRIVGARLFPQGLGRKLDQAAQSARCDS